MNSPDNQHLFNELAKINSTLNKMNSRKSVWDYDEKSASDRLFHHDGLNNTLGYVFFGIAVLMMLVSIFKLYKKN